MGVEFMFAALPAIVSTATLGVVGYVGKKVVSFLHDFKTEHSALIESQRNQLKASIVRTYQVSVGRGHITPLELDAVNREYDSYKALGGNHYVRTLVKRMNAEMRVEGEGIPETSHGER